MRLVIPFAGRSVVIGSERTQRTAPRRWLGLGAMMVGVAAVALGLWGGKQVIVRYKQGSDFVITYYVGDLLPTHPESPTASDMATSVVPLKSSVPRDVWWSGQRSVTPFFMTSSVIVRDTKAGHAQVQAWLHQKRGRIKAETNGTIEVPRRRSYGASSEL